ncbi:MAG: hypothetical protein GXC73_18780 [Chitinophagaceae bacterium]|nr:hypothetical protein [Chitinophagaceae bacterium]
MRYSQQLLATVLIFFIFFLPACSNSAEQKDNQQEKTAETPSDADEPAHYCYELNNEAAVVELELVVGPDDMVSGDLVYQLTGKDKNSGTFKGVIQNDTILADYKFMSEGKESVRELTFLKSDSALVEGYAAMEEADGKMQFKAGVIPDYSKGLKLMLIKCKN